MSHERTAPRALGRAIPTCNAYLPGHLKDRRMALPFLMDVRFLSEAGRGTKNTFFKDQVAFQVGLYRGAIWSVKLSRHSSSKLLRYPSC